MSRNNNSQQVAVIQPPRMQMPAHLGESYGLNDDSWRALTDAIFPTAKTVGAVVLALELCKRLRLDIFQRVVHIVPIYVNGREIESVWPGIAQLRVMAQRQDGYAGYGDCEFGPDITEEFTGQIDQWADDGKGGRRKSGSNEIGVELTFPEWAQFTVFRIINGERVPLPGPKVYFKETYAWRSGKCPVPNDMWQKRPRGQLEKCAEAAAWRRAFPDVLGNEYAVEEMMGRNWGDGAIDGHFVEVPDDEGAKPAQDERKVSETRPKRENYGRQEQTRQKPADESRNEQEHARRAANEPDGALNRLDQPGMPGSPEQWRCFADDFIERLRLLESVEAIDELEARQRERIDAAPPAISAELLDEIAQRVDDLAKSTESVTQGPAGDGPSNQGGNDEEVGG